ncbi:MAG: hypothetical protein AB1781_04670 [Pseudomonadota bacterium]
MNVSSIPTLLQALAAQPVPPKSEGSPAVQAAQRVLATRQAEASSDRAKPRQPPPSAAALRTETALARAHTGPTRDLPRGSLLDILA